MQTVQRYLINQLVIAYISGYHGRNSKVYDRRLTLHRGVSNPISFTFKNEDQKAQDITAKTYEFNMIDSEMNRELPIILLKCVRAYHDYSNKYRNRDIWNVVPKYFKQIQKQVAMVASSLTNFLESTYVVLGDDLFVPQKDFVTKFNQHCKENNLGSHKFHQDFYAGPFSSREIEVRVETVKYKGRVCKNQPIIYGLDIVTDDLTYTDDN